MSYPMHHDPHTVVPQQPQPDPSSKRKRILAIAIAVAAVFAIANIAVITVLLSDSGEPGSDAADGGDKSSQASEESDDTASQDTESQDTGSEDPLEVSYEWPKGFSDSGSYIVAPLFDNRQEFHATMDDVSSYESLFIVSYVMDEDTTGASEEELIDLAEDFGKTAGKENSDTPGAATESDVTVVYDYIEAPGGSGTITYETFYVFIGTSMIQIGCQFDKEQATVGDACNDLLDTLSW